MWKLLQRVQFSKAYLFNKDEEWYSEFLLQSDIKNMDNNKREVSDKVDKLKKDYWIARTYDTRVPANASYWLTVHNSTYDISKKKLRVTIQENYKKYFEFKLD